MQNEVHVSDVEIANRLIALCSSILDDIEACVYYGDKLEETNYDEDASKSKNIVFKGAYAFLRQVVLTANNEKELEDGLFRAAQQLLQFVNIWG